MTKYVYIHSEKVVGRIVSLMAYGATVNYSVGGIEFFEMLGDEDYEVIHDDLDDGVEFNDD